MKFNRYWGIYIHFVLIPRLYFWWNKLMFKCDEDYFEATDECENYMADVGIIYS